MTNDEQIIKAALDMAAATCEQSAYAADADGHHFAYSIRAITPADVLAGLQPRCAECDEGILPCPFCGGPAEVVEIDEGENAGGSCVCCTKCLASGSVEFGFKENFVSNWNRRVQLPAPDPLCGWESLEAATRTAYLAGYYQSECGLPVPTNVSRLSYNNASTPATIARLVEAANQARMAFAGYVTVQSAIDKLDETLAAMEASHD